jgi:hypothetical protein
MQLLSGMPAGEPDDGGNYPDGSYNALIQRRIADLQSQQAKFARKNAAENSADEQRSD